MKILLKKSIFNPPVMQVVKITDGAVTKVQRAFDRQVAATQAITLFPLLSTRTAKGTVQSWGDTSIVAVLIPRCTVNISAVICVPAISEWFTMMEAGIMI